MKTFRNYKAFEKRITKSTAWDDYFTVAGRIFKIYEYGDTTHGSYADFVNKRTHDCIHIEYILPKVNWIKKDVPLRNNERVTETNDTHKKVISGEYRLLSMEVIPNMALWRVDTL